jgi:hypothetical protein
MQLMKNYRFLLLFCFAWSATILPNADNAPETELPTFESAKPSEHEKSWDSLLQDYHPVFPTEIGHYSTVHSLNGQTYGKFIINSVKSLKTSFGNQDASDFIYNNIQKIIESTDHSHVKLFVWKFRHSWGKYSVMARLSPAVKKSDETIVLGSFIDFLNEKELSDGHLMSTDSTGAGPTANLIALKHLYQSKDFIPIRPIEFHFYASGKHNREASADIVMKYKAKRVNIYGMIQTDPVLYSNYQHEIRAKLMEDPLIKFLSLIISTYTKYDLLLAASFGTSASDHINWYSAGYQSACFNVIKMHTGDELINTAYDGIIFNELIRIIIATVVELSLSYEPPIIDWN